MQHSSYRAIKAIALLVAALAASNALCGCATMKKKFIRKKPERVIQPVVYTEDKFVKQYSNKYYYSTHFSNWRTWHDELLNSMSDNTKRQERAVQEALMNLQSMQKQLISPKKEELGAQIAEVREAAALLESGKSASDASVRLKLERTRRVINSGFYYDKVKDFIPAETVDLGAAEPTPQAP